MNPPVPLFIYAVLAHTYYTSFTLCFRQFLISFHFTFYIHPVIEVTTCLSSEYIDIFDISQ